MEEDKYPLGNLKWVKFYDSDTGDLLFSNDFESYQEEEDTDITKEDMLMTNEILIELKERLETMQNAIYETINMIDEVVEEDFDDRNLDIKAIVRLNRIERELDDCFAMIIEESL